MLESHPLASIPPALRGKILALLLALTLIAMAVFALTGAPLQTHEAPLGIISWQVAGSVEAAERMLASWDNAARVRAAFGLGFDYLFMVIYATTIALACLWASDELRRRGWPLQAKGPALAWGLWLAALLDAIENAAQVIMLFDAVRAPWPQISFVCASLKFSLILLGLLYVIYGVWAAIGRRLSAG